MCILCDDQFLLPQVAKLAFQNANLATLSNRGLKINQKANNKNKNIKTAPRLPAALTRRRPPAARELLL